MAKKNNNNGKNEANVTENVGESSNDEKSKKKENPNPLMDIKQFLETKKLSFTLSDMIISLYRKRGFKIRSEWEEILKKELEKKII